MKKVRESRWSFSGFYIVLAALVTCIIALIFWTMCIICGDSASFVKAFAICYALFGAVSIPMAFITLIWWNNEPVLNASAGLSAWIYYGGVFISGLLRYYVLTQTVALILGYLFSILIALIIIIKISSKLK